MTEKQQQILETLTELDVNPTVRSLADHLETRKYRTERWSDDEVRGLLERLEAAGKVAQYEGDKGEQRFRVEE